MHISPKRNKFASSKIIFVFCLISICFISVNETLASEPNISNLSKLLSSPDWRIRAKAAGNIPYIEDIKDDEKVELILNSLKREIQNPFSEELIPRRYLTNTEHLKRQYMFAICSLKVDINAILHSHLDTASGEFRERLLLTLGLMTDSTVHDQVVDIYEESADSYIRLLAILALRNYSDPDDIPVIKKAISDSFYVEYIKDWDPDNKKTYFIRPIA